MYCKTKKKNNDLNVFLSKYWDKRITLNVKKDTVCVNEVFIQTI